MLTKQRLAPNVWAVYGETQSEIGKAFVRFQEYYENKDLRGRKDLTVSDIESWWNTQRKADNIKDSYYEYWVGFNIPGRVFLELTMSPLFRTGATVKSFFCNLIGFRSFYEQENQLLALIADIPADEILSSYFIGLSTTRDDVLEHELAHAFFTLSPVYRSSQLHNIGCLPKEVYEGVRKELIEWGYHTGVVYDEIQAYMSTYVSTIPTTFDVPGLDKYTQPFVDTFIKFRAIEEERLRNSEFEQTIELMPL